MRLLFILIIALNGCSLWAKKECPKPKPLPPPEVVKIEKSCTLPKISLPGFTRTEEPPCPTDWSCYDMENGAKLADRLSKMKGWIVKVRARCGDSRKTLDKKK